MYVPSKLSTDIHFTHISIHQNKLSSEFILVLSGPEDNFNNLIYDIPINHKTKTETNNGIIGLNRVHWSDISIGNSRDGVDAPIQGIQILEGIGQGVDGRISR